MTQSLSERVDLLRLEADRNIGQAQRSVLGQFMTPAPVARLMAGLFEPKQERLRLLDPGAGVGSLTAAFVERLLLAERKPEAITVDAYEIDPVLVQYLNRTLELCGKACEDHRVSFAAQLHQADYLTGLSRQGTLWAEGAEDFDCVIMNPPYGKINQSSLASAELKSAGIRSTNKYSAFMLLAGRQLRAGGEFVSITPRSFSNGTYFRPFRREFFGMISPRLLHLFESRTYCSVITTYCKRTWCFTESKGALRGQ